MSFFQKVSLVSLRVGLGWVFLWAGVTKLLDPAWSAAGYLNAAKTFPDLFHWFASPGALPAVNALNAWGLTLVGIALILGVGVRIAAAAGSALMVLYYLPILDFPYPNKNAFLIDDHIVYVMAFGVLAAFRAGGVWGLGPWCAKTLFAKHPSIARLIE